MNTIRKFIIGFALFGSFTFNTVQIKADNTLTQQITQSVWRSIQNNSTSTLHNLYMAGCNLLKFVPGTLKQITKEANIMTSVLKECPLTSTIVFGCAAYGLWKAYKSFYPNQQQVIINKCHLNK